MQGNDYFTQDDMQQIADGLKKLIAEDTDKLKTLTDPAKIKVYQENIARLQRTLDIYITKHHCN